VVGGFQTQANLSGNYGVTSNFTVYNGGYLNNDVKQKDLSVKASGLDVETAMNTITLQITQAFLNILLVRENIMYLKDLLTTSQAQLTQGQQRYDAGSISRKDFIQLQSEVAMDQFNLTYAQNNYRQNLVTLKQVLQLTSEVNFDIVAPDTLLISPEVPSLKDAEQAALQTRPEIKSAEFGVKVAEVDLQKSKAGRLPVVSLGASVASGYSDNQSIKFGSQLNNNFYQRLGLAVSVPIFNNRIAKTNIELSKIQIEQAKLSLQSTKTTLDQAVEQAYISWSNAQSQYAAADVQFKTNEESYHITTEQLRLGAVNMVDLLQQRTLYIQSLQLFIQAKYSAILNQKIFDFYSGVPITL
jgi:outer membrane protein